MTIPELESEIKRLGMSIPALAAALGMHKRSLERMRRGIIGISKRTELSIKSLRKR